MFPYLFFGLERFVTRSGLRAGLIAALVAGGLILPSNSACAAEKSSPPSGAHHANSTQPAQEEPARPWMQPIPVPADPELEAQIVEIREALSTIDMQTVRRKEAVERTSDATTQATLYQEIELLRKERDALEGLLRQLVDEARASERTAIDEALARVKVLEQEREHEANKDELLLERRQ